MNANRSVNFVWFGEMLSSLCALFLINANVFSHECVRFILLTYYGTLYSVRVKNSVFSRTEIVFFLSFWFLFSDMDKLRKENEKKPP